MTERGGPPRPAEPGPKPAPRVGRASEFLGSRLVLIGALSGIAGFVLLGVVGFEVWRLATGGRPGRDVVILVVGGALAAALLSIAGSAWRAGVRYLSGERTVARDVGRFVARRLERRRGRRGR